MFVCRGLKYHDTMDDPEKLKEEKIKEEEKLERQKRRGARRVGGMVGIWIP